MAEYDVFLSYKREDEEILNEVYNKLTKNGITCFKDVGLIAGEKWEEKLEDALRNSKILIVLISQNTQGSKWVNFELGFSYALNKQIIPLIIDDSKIETIDLAIVNKFQAVYLNNIDKIIKDIKGNILVKDGDVNGLWEDIDSDNGDFTYFQQRGNRVVGFYKLKESFNKNNNYSGIYIGYIKNRKLKYYWYNDEDNDYGRGELELSNNKLSGRYYDDESDATNIVYDKIDSTMPTWINQKDFDNIFDNFEEKYNYFKSEAV